MRPYSSGRKKKLKILLWGTVSDIYTLGLIENVLAKDPRFELFVLDTQVKDRDKNTFHNLGVNLIKSPTKVINWYKNNKKGGKSVAAYMHLIRLKSIMKHYGFDIINIHFVDPINLFTGWILKRHFQSKLILSYWGSDLLRTSIFWLKSIKPFVKAADYITFENDDLRFIFEKVYKDLNEDKRETVYFGLSILDEIKKKSMEMTRDDIRKKLGLPLNKRVVAIGYNAIPQQQHFLVLDQIRKLDQTLKDAIILLLQLTYPANEDYKEKICAILPEIGCEFVVVKNYLTNEEVAEYRLVTDIFINSQTTDAFSGTVCECLYSGSILLNAKWLKYTELDKYGLEFNEFSNFTEIPKLLSELVDKSGNSTVNSSIMHNLRSWEHCAERWSSVFERALRHDV